MKLPRHLRLVVPRYAWFEPRHCTTSVIVESQLFLGKTKAKKDEARDVLKDQRRGEKAV